MAEIPLVMPKMSMTMEEGTFLTWHKAEGDEVRAGDVVCEVATDKVDMEVESPVDGILARLVAQPDDVVAVGEPIAYLSSDADDLLGDLLDGPAEAEAPPPAPAVLATTPAPPLSLSTVVSAVPLARSRAVELGVDLATLTGTGPGGTIRVVDVEAGTSLLVAPPVHVPHGPPATNGAPAGTGAPASRPRSRRTVARQTSASAAIPQAVVFRDLDLDAVAERRGRCGWLSLIVRAYADALRDSPLNARWTGEGSEVWSDVAVGLMVDTEHGPVAPVLVDPDRFPIEELDVRLARLADQARSGKVPVEHLTPATTTVHDLGPLGVDAFQELLNPPQATALSVGAVAPHVVPVGDGVGVRTRCRVGLTVDHRVGDCADAARLLNAVQRRLDDPNWFGWR
ncbi:2-oxo acid dehydrogenase subunit E2 [Streptomyces caniscabiei]|uniref:2-oxo acid dehydrogenase subunit E2 n=1 Tax=Streptomyces caniscabiei TaxID=2746961 RepID=UPI0029ACFD81|nr:2-oxo acid dehydrogenase subunit E2 [Streptomyces caniscabiei]MDX2602643.1 2-oxo acid dehydrogenase subunit E2 [Streptomyces caniscabiei]MDX2734499.1 2-oxo acid dehydrogenase subunit E2 [Streptomyces caniscabiei]MDX2778669.1 2-oxo acid dehydrogenase subunit E2 [Streptomyces caniscabiei]